LITSPLALAGVVALVVALAFWLDRRVKPLSRIGASLLAIILGAILSNLGLVPSASPIYDAVGGPVTSLAIAWLLLSVNLSDLKEAGGPMVAAFGVAVIGTALGAAVGAFLFAGAFGEDTWKLAGTLTGTYSGGSVNFVSVGRGVGLPDRLFAGATAADNLTTGLWLGASLMLPLALRKFYPTPIPGESPGAEDGPTGSHGTASGGVDVTEEHHPFFRRVEMSVLDLAMLMAVGFVLVLVSDWLGQRVPVVPSVLWLTTLALIIGHVGPFQRPPGALQLGTLALHFFFVIIGIHSRIAEIAAVGVEVFLYTLVVVGVHGLVVYGVGRVARIDLGTLSVASQASVGGPSSALAVAVSREWKPLILPGIIVGLVGYAVGNYLGFGVAYLVRGLGVGL
jgi:uncharacterized membrane protein